MNFQTLLRISRPRFWHYVLWPMLIYFAASGYFVDMQASFVRWGTDWIFQLIIMLIILWYFTLPANLWIYGRNDIADGDTDKFNSKKWSYEEKVEDSDIMKKELKSKIWLWNKRYIGLWAWWILIIRLFKDYINIQHNEVFSFVDFILQQAQTTSNYKRRHDLSYILVSMIAICIPFLLIAYLYSCKPLRAKAKPFIDGIMNVLYIAVPFSIIVMNIIWSYYYGYESSYDVQLITYNFLASLFRCMAMHCYSAIPDIEPDRQAWLTTTAVYLEKQNSLIYCGILYLLSALLSFSTLWWFSVVAGIIYISVMMISYYKKDIFALYKIFPYINLIIWFLLFWYIIVFW